MKGRCSLWAGHLGLAVGRDKVLANWWSLKPLIRGLSALCWEGECSSVTWRALLISDTGYFPSPRCQELGERALWGQSGARSSRHRQGRSQRRWLWYKPWALEMENKSKRRNLDSCGRKHAHTYCICCSISGTSTEQASSSCLATPGRQTSQLEVRAFSVSAGQTWVQVPVLLLYLLAVWHWQVPALSLPLPVKRRWVEYGGLLQGLNVGNMLGLVPAHGWYLIYVSCYCYY